MDPPYSALAKGYDVVMEHVDYDRWAAYVHMVLQRHGEATTSIVELGGGTGSLALRLQPLGPYEYTLTDGSAAMLRQAREKFKREGCPVRCAQAEFTSWTLEQVGCEGPVDAVVLVYDGLNYLLENRQVAACFQQVYRALRSGGVFVFDQSTPANSKEHRDAFVDEGTTGSFAYVRESRYDPETRRHVTTFEIAAEGRRHWERHVQRAYTLDEIRALLNASPLHAEAAYDGFTTTPAHPGSHRVHWVARRRGPEEPSAPPGAP